LIDIAKISEIDHFVTLVGDSDKIFKDMKPIFEEAGFPMSLKTGKGGKDFQTITVHIGQSYFEFLRLIGGRSDGWADEVNKWYEDNIRGVVILFLHSKNLEEIYQEMRRKKIFINEPYRDYYWVGREKKSFPWMYLDLPAIGSIPLRIRWVQYDTMVWNMVRIGPKPNSRDLNGADHFSLLKISGPFNEHDFALFKKVFQSIGDNNNNTVNLRTGSLVFEKSDKTHFEFTAPTNKKKYQGKSVEIYNFNIKVVRKD